MADKENLNKNESTDSEKAARQVFLDASTPPARSIIRTISISLVALFSISLLLFILYQLSFLLFLIILAIFFAYLLDPLVKLIRRPFKQRNLEKIMPRPLAIVISYSIVFTVVGLVIAYLAPLIETQVREFAGNLPNYATRVQENLVSLNNRFDQLMISEEVQKQINENISQTIQSIGGFFVTGFIGVFALNILTYLPWLLLVPILGFFFLKDAYLFRTIFLDCFPSGHWRARADSLLMDVNKTLAAYTRAQLISCLLIGTLCTLGFTLIGLDYSLLLGILAGIFEFVPLLGPLTIGTIATLVALFSGNPWQALWTLSFLLILRFTHDYVTYPRIVRDGVHLHPFAVILSVLAGEQLAGIPGVFLSIPIVAIITVLYKHILKHSGRKGIFAEFLNSKNVKTKNNEIKVTE